MKRLVFKKWVEYVLYFILVLTIFFSAFDCDDLKLFVIVKLICFLIIATIYLLLKKYSRDF